MVESVDKSINVEHRLPVFSQYVETYIPFQVDVWVENFGLALDFRGFVRVNMRNLEREREASGFVVTFGWLNGDRKVHEVVFAVGESYCT
ncbi:hypothetical protein LINGRAHAP2_LOCUS14857 [Linum grandiflorum]